MEMCDLPARLPMDPSGHGAQRQPEEQDGVEEGHRYPLPELPVVEQLGALRGSVEGGVRFPGHVCTRPEKITRTVLYPSKKIGRP